MESIGTVSLSAQTSLELDAALYGVLLSAESVREGAAGILDAAARLLDDTPAAIALLDRDGLTLQVVAECAAPRAWPCRLDPRLERDVSPASDTETGVLVAPLRAQGRIVGALMLGDGGDWSSRRESLLDPAVLSSIAAALDALVRRCDSELRRRARALRSTESVLEAMAHQITNPLTGASSIAQLLLDDLSDEGARSAVRQITSELNRSFAVLRDMLEFQLDTGAQDGVVELNTLIERLLRFRGYPIREHGIALQFHPIGGYVGLHADAAALELAFLEALRFAELRSHSSVNRSLTVRITESAPHEVSVDITDSGPGDVPDLSPKYFDRRWQEGARELAAVAPDLGLVDSILRGCGGRLQCRASKTEGTTLSLVLPRAKTTVASISAKVPR
jgi:K+-sensing histidine kinase KdpD